jgi:SNF2 family DNA or RNA helicase
MMEFKHQTWSLNFMKDKKRVFDASDPGTGKTYIEIMDFVRQHKKDKKPMLVFAPKSLLQAAWANDIKKFAPHLKVSIAWAKNRTAAFDAVADVYITNIDAVKDVAKFPPARLKKFGRVVIDESTAYKHHTSARSRAAAKVVKHIDIRRLMSGTPNPNGICDLWHQYFLLDDGVRLGRSFYGFRSACCIPEQTGPMANMLKWNDKPGIENTVAALVGDITIRHKFEDCVDIPENHKYAVSFELSTKHKKQYEQLKEESILLLRKTSITAINGAALATKLLQTASGAVYDDSGGYSRISTERYELVLDLVEARRHSIVFYQWQHQLDELIAEAKSRKVDFVVWNPDTPEIEQHFQKGFYQVLFAHPASAGHGLTLTKGTATIWASPTINLEHFQQGLKRVHRIGQTERTETVVVVAEGTVDEKVWASLQNKKFKMDEFFESLAA